MMKKPEILIYTDGSSRGNPGPGGWGTIVATRERVVELGGGEERTTNNRMELRAAIAGLSFVRDLGSEFSIDVRADSSYVLNGITKWVFGWQKNGWVNSKKEDVINRDLWEELVLAVADLKMSGCTIAWNYAPGHAGIPGNERADEIATMCADKMFPQLFDGARSTYEVDLTPVEGDAKKLAAKKTKSKSKSGVKAYSYLSLVGGKLMKHATWAECEKRVKGVPGTKFKKSTSADDERAIMSAWGVR
ncbi:MAG: RNase H family protein [Patescibacteria group bacterium]